MNARVRIKFCGITRVDDARIAAALGVDAIGLVFASRSPRCIDFATARAIRAGLPPFVSVVALFMDDASAQVEQVIAKVAPDALQFHGDEDAAFCERFARPYLKVIAMGSEADAGTSAARHPRAAGFLLDGHAIGERGGSGHTFDWTRATKLGRPVILAGGLHADNVAQAIATARPYGVDVSSGIESAPGIKDAAKMQRFVEAVCRTQL